MIATPGWSFLEHVPVIPRRTDKTLRVHERCPTKLVLSSTLREDNGTNDINLRRKNENESPLKTRKQTDIYDFLNVTF